MLWAKPELGSRGWNLNPVFLLSISEMSGLSVYLWKGAARPSKGGCAGGLRASAGMHTHMVLSGGPQSLPALIRVLAWEAKSVGLGSDGGTGLVLTWSSSRVGRGHSHSLSSAVGLSGDFRG